MTVILLAYATRNGSTREVVDAIAAMLRETGVEVRVRAARTVRAPIEEADLIVLGAPLYNGRWHRDAHRLLKRHRDTLRRLPVAVFGMGPRRDTPEAWAQARSQLNRALTRHSWLTPLTVAVFGGADSPKHRLHRDLRDWNAIEAWALGICRLSERTAAHGAT
ncbi:flavodoxin domain-containing protein [Nonomuraea maheshkhaliensis]|uniref:Flavodoxin domain-containing protein n=1 Tax=Nonomuraea maheshkhaliensis TaxID=419590 RepID=A0ABN2FNU1_9ACTN